MNERRDLVDRLLGARDPRTGERDGVAAIAMLLVLAALLFL